MGQAESKTRPVNSYKEIAGLEKEKMLKDKMLIQSLENVGYKLTDVQVQRAKCDGGIIFYQLGELNYELEKYPEAYTWFYKASKQNNSNAQTALGFIHELEDMELTYLTATQCYIIAEKNDKNKHAQCGIPEMLRRGKFFQVNTNEAFKWYEKSARQGHVFAQFMLGTYFQVVNEFWNLQTAVDWYQAASDNGFVIAESFVKELGEKKIYPKNKVQAKTESPLKIRIVEAEKLKDRVIIEDRNCNIQQQKTPSKNKPQFFQVDNSPTYNDRKLLKKRVMKWLKRSLDLLAIQEIDKKAKEANFFK